MPNGFEKFGETSNGYELFRKLEPHGGYSYWTSEFGTPFLYFDEGLHDKNTMYELLETIKK